MTSHCQNFRSQRDPVRIGDRIPDERCQAEKHLLVVRRKLRFGLMAVLLASVPACDLLPVDPGNGGIEDPSPDPQPEPEPEPDPEPNPQPDPDPEPDPGNDGILVIEPRGAALQGTGAADADDPAIWIHPEDPARSLLFLSDKARGIYVFDLQGNQVQHVEFGTRLNNIDVRSGFAWKGKTIDVLAGNLRSAGKLALLQIHRDWQPGQAVTVLADANSSGNRISPDSYGFALYRRASDGALFVFDKSDGSPDARQWRIREADGEIVTTQVRVFADVTMGRAEGFVVDDRHGYVYMAEERGGIHQYHADPQHPMQDRVDFFAQGDAIEGDREGLALYGCPDGGGYLILSSQGNSTFKVYERNSHRLVRTFRASGTHGTDGLDVTARAVPGFPQGFLVIHDEPGARYLIYDWSDVAAGTLQSCGH